MKSRKTILFPSVCLLVFLFAATGTCVLRAKYSSVPACKITFAYAYAANLKRYSLLQYNQASPEEGRQALLLYVQLLQRIRTEKIKYSQALLHRDFGLAYLRLYRLESAAANSAAADTYMRSAQEELSGAGLKDVSSTLLDNLIKTRETKEERLYNTVGTQGMTPQTKQPMPQEKSQ